MKYYLIEPIWDNRSQRVAMSEFREALESVISPTSVSIDGENVRFLFKANRSKFVNPFKLLNVKYSKKNFRFTVQIVTKKGLFLNRLNTNLVVGKYDDFSGSKPQFTDLREKGVLFEGFSKSIADDFLELSSRLQSN